MLQAKDGKDEEASPGRKILHCTHKARKVMLVILFA